ncbi:unnamed protein product [Cochlearia groenlandica]
MDSSQYNPSYGQWNPPYSSPSPLFPPPPPPPLLPHQSHPESPNFYVLSTQNGGQNHDYQRYSHRQDLPPPPQPLNLPSSYYSHHPPPPPPPPQQHHPSPPPQQQHHLPYIPQHVSYDSQRLSQQSSTSNVQSAWSALNENRHDSWNVDTSQGRLDTTRSRVDSGPDRNYQYDYSCSSRESSGISISRGLDGSSRSRDEFHRLGYERKESGATRIEGNYQERGQVKSESDNRYFRGLSSSSGGYGSERYSVMASRGVNRSSAATGSHERDRNQRWDEAHNRVRDLYTQKKKDDYYHSEVEQYLDWKRRERSNESKRTPTKQIQKKSALLRLETPRSHQNGRENDWSRHQSHYNAKRFKGKEQLGHSCRGLVEKQRGTTPVDLDVSFKSNVLVAKPVPSPKKAGIHPGQSLTSGSSKARRTLLPDKNEKASVTEGNAKLITHLSDKASVSEGIRQSLRRSTASDIEKKPDNHSALCSSDVECVNRKGKMTDTGPEASTHDSDPKVRNTVHASEKISRLCEALKETKDDSNVEHDSNVKACSTEEDVIVGDKSMMKSHEDVLNKKGTASDVGKVLLQKMTMKENIMKTKNIGFPTKLFVSWPTTSDLSGCSAAEIQFASKSMCGDGSQPCEDEVIDCIPSRNLPIMKVNAGFEEKKFIDSSIGSLGYLEKDFEKSSLEASIFFNRKDPGDQVLSKLDIGGIEVDSEGVDKNVDSLFPENDSPRGLPNGFVSSASLDVPNVSTELTSATNNVSGDRVNANSFTVINTLVKLPDIPRCESTVSPSVENENGSRKESMETKPHISAAEMPDDLDSKQGRKTCVKGTSSSLSKVDVNGTSSVILVERLYGCSYTDEAMSLPSEVCMENVTERFVAGKDLGLASQYPAGIPSVDQFGGPDNRGLKTCLPEPNVSVGKNMTGGSSECLIERDVGRNDSIFCDNIPSSSSLVTDLAIGISGISANETVTDAESGHHENLTCSTGCKFSLGDRCGCGSVSGFGSVWNLSMDKNLEEDHSRVSSCLLSDNSVNPCHISPLVAVNELIQNKTSIQPNYSDSKSGIMYEENNFAENMEVDTQEDITKPSAGTSKHRTPETGVIAVTEDSVFRCDSLSSSPRKSFGQIQSEIHEVAVVDENCKDKQKPKHFGGTSKHGTQGTDIRAFNGDSVPCDSLSNSPRLYRQIQSEVHVLSMVDDTSSYKEKRKPSSGTSKYRTPDTDIVAVSVNSVFPSDSASSSPRLSFKKIRSEIHVPAMVNKNSKGKESQKEDDFLDTLQEHIMTSHEVFQAGSSSMHNPGLVKIPSGADDDSYVHPMPKYPGGGLSEMSNGDPMEKLTVVPFDDVSQEKYSSNGAKADIFDRGALSSDGKVSGTVVPGGSSLRLSRAHPHTDVKLALTHGKDDAVFVPHKDSQTETSLSSSYQKEKMKTKSSNSTQKSYPRSLPSASDTKKDANLPTHITKRRTWHRKSDTSSYPFVAVKPLSSTLSTQQKFPIVTAQSSTSYVRKGNSLLRKPSYDSHGVTLGLPPSAIQLNRIEDKSIRSASTVDGGNASVLGKTRETSTLERQSKPPSDSSTSKVSNVIATSSGKCVLSYSMDHLTTGLPESIMDSATSGEANVTHTGGDTFKTSDALIKEGYASDCQQKRNLPKLDTSNLRKMVYVKRRANQLVAASDISGASKNQMPPSDGYFKLSKNQLVRTSEGHVNHLPVDALDSRAAPTVVSERSSSSAFSDSAVTRPYKKSKFSLVWTQNDSHPRLPVSRMHYQRILPQLVPWKRVTYWRRLMGSASALRNGSFSNISQKLSLMRKRHTVYTRSTDGYSLRKSKVLSIGGSHLKWSKSIERDSRKANEEATLAVAAYAKNESGKHSGQSSNRTTSRNHLARERVFRFGSLRYKMDSSRRTLQRISDVDSPCSGPSGNGKSAKRPFIPKRLVIGNEEYVRVGNGNQLVRDPKKRTRILANEKVRWSLHNARLRLAKKKKKYCQFFTRFGKCNKDDGKCSYVHDPSKIAVCTKFLNGLCSNANCKLTHKVVLVSHCCRALLHRNLKLLNLFLPQVIPERMPDCSYFLQGLCNNETCSYRHVHVNPSAAICDGFLKGYCSDGDKCRKKHSYTCPDFEDTGSCSKGSKCKLHHPKNQSKGRKRKRPTEPSEKNARGRYFGSSRKPFTESEPMLVDRHPTEEGDVFGTEGLEFITLGFSEYEAGDNNDSAEEQSISRDSQEPVSIRNLIRPVALMQ